MGAQVTHGIGRTDEYQRFRRVEKPGDSRWWTFEMAMVVLPAAKVEPNSEAQSLR